MSSVDNSGEIAHQIDSALDSDDVYLIYYRLKDIYTSGLPADKKIGSQNPTIFRIHLPESTLLKLAEFIKELQSLNHLFSFDFSSFLNIFMLEVEPSCAFAHLLCLSRVSNLDLEYYRKLYSYSRIYNIFRAMIQNVTENSVPEVLPTEYIQLLIRLLNNNKLVYKNLLPIISKFNLFISKNIVDKNIATCCSVMNALVLECKDMFNPELITSLSCYLLGIIINPHNHLFLKSAEMSVIFDTLSSLIVVSSPDRTNYKSAIGMLRQAGTAFSEYCKSTVSEEIMTSLYSLEIITPIFNLALACGCKDFKFLTMINFSQADYGFCRKREDEIVAQRYIIGKYKFINMAQPYLALFSPISLFNDLLRIDSPIAMISQIPNLYENISWSDIIPIAVQSPNKSEFIYLLFHPVYLSKAGHAIYLELFYKSCKDEPSTLLYFTAYVILWLSKGMSSEILDASLVYELPESFEVFSKISALATLAELIPDLFFVNPGSKEYCDVKRHRILLKYINVANNEVLDIFVDYLEKNSVEESDELFILLLILVERVNNEEKLLKLHGILEKRAHEMEFTSEKNAEYVALRALLLSRVKTSIFEIYKSMKTKNELVIGLFYCMLKGGSENPEKIQKIKADGFDILSSMNEKEIKEVLQLSSSESIKTSKYYEKYEEISKFIKEAS